MNQPKVESVAEVLEKEEAAKRAENRAARHVERDALATVDYVKARDYAITHRLAAESEFGTGNAVVEVRAADSAIAVEVADRAIKKLQAFKRAHNQLAKLDGGDTEE